MIEQPPGEQGRPELPASLLLAGAGKMGGALLTGWLDIGMPGARITVVDPHADAAALAPFQARGVVVNPERSALKTPTVLVLAIKPQSLAAAAPALSAFVGSDTLLLSVIAGKTMADLARTFPSARAVARAMPNTPAAVRRGITGVAVNAAVSTPQTQVLAALLGAVGAVAWLSDEAAIDAVTAVSGSGPAYVFYLVECLARAGESLGLDSAVALQLARATVEGAGALLSAQPEAAPDTLRHNVTSPGGTTAAALDVLMKDDRLASAMTEAVTAAARRAAELSG